MFDLSHRWNPSMIHTAGDALSAYLRRVESAGIPLNDATRSVNVLCGLTATALQGYCGRAVSFHEAFARDVAELRGTIGVLAEDLTSCETTLQSLRDEAYYWGLEVVDDVVYSPFESGDQWSEENADRQQIYQRMEQDYLTTMSRVDSAFASFHQSLASLFSGAAETPGVAGRIRDDVSPATSLGAASSALSRVDNLAAGVVWTNLHFSRATVGEPITLAGDKGVILRKLVITSEQTRLEKLAFYGKRAWYGRDPLNWVKNEIPPKPLSQGARFVQGHSKVLQRAGVGASVVSGAMGAWEQWEKDGLRPDLSQGERAIRAVAKGTFSGGGGWAGATVGAHAGAALGVWAGPIGAGVGAVIGGVVGGAIGATALGAIADSVLGWFWGR